MPVVEPAQPPSPSSTNMANPTPPLTSETLDPAARELVLRAQTQLAQKLGIDMKDISLESIEAVEWPDTSLGCPQMGMLYAQVVTPGYQVILEAAGEQYEYHTGADRFLVLCEKEGASEVVPRKVPTILSEEIVTTPVNGELLNLINIAKKDLARRLKLTSDEIEVLHVEKAEWPDTSLGCAEPGLTRRPVVIPGYRIVLSTMDQEYVYHTDRENGVVFCPKG